MLPFIDKVTTGTWSLVLVIIKSTPVIWPWCFVNTHVLPMINQVLFHGLSGVNQESSETSNIFLWNSDFSITISYCWLGWSICTSFIGSSASAGSFGLSGVFTSVSVFYLNDLPSEVLSSTSILSL